MLDALAAVAREARIAAELTQLDIATAAGTNHATISRFEGGRRWPLDPDRIIRAYEIECGLSEGELWKRAAAKLG